MAYYQEDFVKVIKAGRINLYLHATTGGVVGSTTYHEVFTYLVEKDGVVMRMKKSDFKDHMANLVADYPDLQRRIHIKEMKYDQLEQIIALYNDWYIRQGKLTGKANRP